MASQIASYAPKWLVIAPTGMLFRLSFCSNWVLLDYRILLMYFVVQCFSNTFYKESRIICNSKRKSENAEKSSVQIFATSNLCNQISRDCPLCLAQRRLTWIFSLLCKRRLGSILGYLFYVFR